MRPLAVLLIALALPATAGAVGRCGTHPWCDTTKSPDARAGMLLAVLTQDEKVGLLSGDDLAGEAGAEGGHSGTINGIPRVDLPPVYFDDGPVGPRQGKATAMPSPMSIAASFDPRNVRHHAGIVGDEVRHKGADFVYAPAVNMLRTPLNGRTFEYFGEDPFLSARTTVAWVKGVQAAGIIANVKHFAVNNQEGQGQYIPGAPVGASYDGSRMVVNAQLDERALREIYLPQFEAAVKQGHVGSVMCAYPRVNGTFACENSHLLEDILKGDWRFKNLVLTDYGAAKNTINSLNNGLDLDIWPAIAYQPVLVNAALTSSQVSQSTLDEHVRRILRTLFAFGFFDRDAYTYDTAAIDQGEHDAAAAAIERHGIVLLRNKGGLLPLDPATTGKLAVIGPEADKIRNGGGSSAINAFKTTTALTALKKRLGDAKIVYADGSDTDEAVAAAKAADTAVVVVGDQMSEGTDKPCLGLNCGQPDSLDRDALISAVAAAQPRTVVVLQSGGPTLTPWRGEVGALLEAWYPGQNGGTAIADVLFGAEPGGRLPGTFPASEADEPTAGDPEKYPGVGETVKYKEGVLIGYRWFDAKQLAVAYPFGFGLSYAKFRFSQLRLRRGKNVVATMRVKNTGTRTGSAVPQLYVGMPPLEGNQPMPPWQLKGFRKVTLRAGKAKRVRFTLDRRAFSHWDSDADQWAVSPGCFRIGVGKNSRSLPLQGAIQRGKRVRVVRTCVR
jgi:beta-glucosidase